MSAPWTDGPMELLQHAVDHLADGGDFDRRIAMISIDNAVELMIKTYLSLPKRAYGDGGPTRKELESAKEAFPTLLDLLEKHADDRITGLSLGDIEWYHRIRNHLYHSGNGITVERSKVDTYLQLASTLFENLFGLSLHLVRANAVHTNLGEFLGQWHRLDKTLRDRLPKKEPGDYAYYWKRNWLKTVCPRAEELYSQIALFRNVVVYAVGDAKEAELDRNKEMIEELLSILEAHPVKRQEI